MHRLFSAALALACATTAWAQAPYLVTDINTSYTPNALSSSPRSFAPAGANVLFSATTDAAGSELFRTDGSTVELVKDIVPGTNGSGPANLVALNASTVVFGASDPVNGLELWKSDGTEAGTVLVKDIAVGGQGSATAPLIAMGGKVFLLATNTSFQAEVWVTDGTDAGTVKLADSPQPTGFRIMGGFLYFHSGTTLWKSDGTPGGTTAVRTDVTIRALTVAGSRLFFAGWDTSHGYELWTSDGTAGGTNLLKDIKPGAGSSFNSSTSFSFGVVGSNVVFFAHEPNSGWSLWRSDGTADGTVPVVNYPTWTATTVPPFLSSANGLAFFSSSGLYRTDGTSGGTSKLGNVLDPFFYVAGGAKVFFFGRDTSDFSYRLWSTDGSDAGTSKVSVLVSPGTQPTAMAWIGGQLYFSGSDGVTGAEPWVSDGTSGGTHQIANLVTDPPASSTPNDLRGTTGRLFFTATDSGPREIWTSDGTPGGTSALTAFLGQKTMFDFSAWKGQLFFNAGTSSSNYSLYHSDGTAAGTTVLKTVQMYHPYASSGHFYFSALPAVTPDPYYYSTTRPWRSDGTPAGTIDLTPAEGGIPIAPSRFVEAGGRVYFEAGEPRGIWRTDGTPGSTVRLTTHSYSSVSSNFVPVNGALYYVLTYGSGSELWRTTIGAQSETTVLEIVPGAMGGYPEQLTAAGSLVFFTAHTPANGRELWRSDGTVAGTFLVKDIAAGNVSANPASLTAVGSTIFFVANNGFDGLELWKSDGTTAGTTIVADIAPGAASSFPDSLVAADGLLWFAADDGATGVELWKSDGTAPGTQRVGDLNPGSIGSAPRYLTVAARQLFFSAHTSAGRELWALALAPTAYAISDARVVEGHTGEQQLRFTVTRSGDVSGAGSVAFITSNGTATAGADYVAQGGTASFGAGVSVAFIDVAVNGDASIEDDEVLFVTISSPSSGVIERNAGTGLIEDDDQVAALSVVHVPTISSYSGARTFVVTNTGPSTAKSVSLEFTESPSVGSFTGTNCSPSGFGKLVCLVGSVLAGESRTVAISRGGVYSGDYRYDSANPPGYTITAVVTTATGEADLSDNTVSRMTTSEGHLLLPPFLVSSTPATATYRSGYTYSSPQTVTLVSSNAGVTVTPPTVTIPANETVASFTLQPGAITGKTKLTISQYGPELVIPIVASGSVAKLDPVVVGGNSTYVTYGNDVKIPIRIAGRRADGTYPTGTVALLDTNGVVLDEETLNATGSVEFIRSGLQPGGYSHRARYDGDANFTSLNVALGSVTVEPYSTNMSVRAPVVICGSTAQIEVFVTAYQTGSPAPTGTVIVQSVQGTLVPTGLPGESKAVVQVPVTSSTSYLSVGYQATGPFRSTSTSYSITVGCNMAMNLVATATASNRVSLTWNSTGATTYDVYRMASGYCCGGSYFSFLGYAGATTYLDTTVTAGQVYVYRVRPTGGAFSAPDIATTVMFTDDPIVPQVTAVRLTHFSEVLTVLSVARTILGISPSAVTLATPPGFGAPVNPATIPQIRSVIASVRTYIGLPAYLFTDPSLTSGMPVKAVHVQELRNALK